MRSPSSRVTTTHKRWNQSGLVAKFSRESVASGEIDLSQQPKATCDTHLIQFEGYTLYQVQGASTSLEYLTGRCWLIKMRCNKFV